MHDVSVYSLDKGGLWSLPAYHFGVESAQLWRLFISIVVACHFVAAIKASSMYTQI